MRHVNPYEATDKAALHDALLQLHTCPTCRRDLKPAAFHENVWVCETCKESWHIASKE